MCCAQAHGYAVRVMWCVFRGIYGQAEAASQFAGQLIPFLAPRPDSFFTRFSSVSAVLLSASCAAYVDIHASAAKFNMEIKNALLCILLLTPAKMLTQQDKLTISFYMPVH